jgi:hypothetical protein
MLNSLESSEASIDVSQNLFNYYIYKLCSLFRVQTQLSYLRFSLHILLPKLLVISTHVSDIEIVVKHAFITQFCYLKFF